MPRKYEPRTPPIKDPRKHTRVHLGMFYNSPVSMDIGVTGSEDRPINARPKRNAIEGVKDAGGGRKVI
jgi:hypothetical protein